MVEKCREDSFKLPPCCTTGGKKVILRADLDNEYTAGQLYAYVIRVLFGEEGMKIALSTEIQEITTS